MVVIPIVIIAVCLIKVLAARLLVDNPWVGSLSFLESPGLKHHCNTILVDRFTVVTAGHCILLEARLNQTKQIPWKKYGGFVIMGVDDYIDSCHEDFQKSAVLNAYLHSDASYGNGFPFENEYDMAALKVERPFNITPTISTVKLFKSEEEYEKQISAIIDLKEKAECAAVGWELDPYPGEVDSSFPRSRSKLESYPVQFHLNAFACGKFDEKRKAVCHGLMGFWNRYPFLVVGGLAPGSAGAPVSCHVGNESYVFAMVSGSISSCFDFCGKPKLEPELVGGIDHENLRNFASYYVGS